MTTESLVELLYGLACLSAFLLLGTFLRAKVKLFQSTFMPASVIGGFLALILGPIVLGVIPIPESWLATFSLLPGILIVPIVASVPLGLKIGKGSGTTKSMINILPTICIMGIIGGLQHIVGFGTNLLFGNMGYDIYQTFGWELPLGFSGGHGSAGLLGNILHSMNLPYWETAQGVAVTSATFGIVGGILIGMVMINLAARKGSTEILQNPSSIPQNIRIGFEKDIVKQASLGRETTTSSSIDTFAFHLALIFAGCGLSYIMLNLLKLYKVPVLSSISIWAYAILVMFILWGIMCKLKIDYLVDGKVKSRISGTFTDFAVVSAIASLPLKAVMAYIVPILVMVVFGFAVTVISVWFISKVFIKEYWFEHGISVFGMSTGVFLTGLLLLRICDPEFESPVLGNYSLAYTFFTILNFAMLQMFIGIIMSKGALSMILVSLLMVTIYGVVLIITKKANKNVRLSV